MMTREEDVVREAVRLYRRYQLELVERFRLCPWAERARVLGHVVERVILSPSEEEQPVLDAIDRLLSLSEVEVALLLFPRLRSGRKEFERFVSRLAGADAARREPGSAPFALAAFHPDAEADFSHPERLIPFIRKTPDPTIQLVRLSALDRVRRGQGEGTHFIDIRSLSTLSVSREDVMPLRERIARDNQETLLSAGKEAFERVFEDIREDRARTYARLGIDAECPCPSS